MKKKASRGSGPKSSGRTAVKKQSLKSRGASNQATVRHLRRELADLKLRLNEAEATINAIRAGEVDALVVNGPNGEQIYTLRGADEPYRVLVESMSEGALTAAPDGAVLYANRHFAELVGTPLERVMGRSLHEFVRAADRGSLEGLLRASAAGSDRAELAIAGNNGEIPAQLSATALNFDGVNAICIIITDLRERIRNEEILASETLARAILDQAAEAMVVCDRDGRIIRANQLAIQLCGSNPLRRSFSEAFPLRYIGAENDFMSSLANRDGRPAAHIPAYGSAIHGVTTELGRTGSNPIRLLMSAAPLLLPGGEIVGSVITMTDITERVRAEDARRFLFETTAALGESLDLDTAL